MRVCASSSRSRSRAEALATPRGACRSKKALLLSSRRTPAGRGGQALAGMLAGCAAEAADCRARAARAACASSSRKAWSLPVLRNSCRSWATGMAVVCEELPADRRSEESSPTASSSRASTASVDLRSGTPGCRGCGCRMGCSETGIRAPRWAQVQTIAAAPAAARAPRPVPT